MGMSFRKTLAIRSQSILTLSNSKKRLRPNGFRGLDQRQIDRHWDSLYPALLYHQLPPSTKRLRPGPVRRHQYPQRSQMGSPSRKPNAALPSICRRKKEAIPGDDPEPMAVHPRRLPCIPAIHRRLLHLEVLLQEGREGGREEGCTR